MQRARGARELRSFFSLLYLTEETHASLRVSIAELTVISKYSILGAFFGTAFHLYARGLERSSELSAS